jgi:hypothetical protein
MGETHLQEALPTVRGKDNASLNAMNGNSRKRQRQSEGNNNDQTPSKRQKQQTRSFSYNKRETEDDWVTFPTCSDCKMKHPKEDNDVCWYLHPDQAKPFFNKAKADQRLKEFRKKNPGC